MRYFIKSLALLFLLLASPVLAGGINNGGGGGGAPTGAAGGDLGGTYPNPTVLSIADVTTGTLSQTNGGTGATGNTSVNDALNNTSALILPKWRAALGRVLAGTGNARILWVGESTTMGAYSNNSGSGDWRLLAIPSQFAAMLNRAGIPASSQSFAGFGQFSADLGVDPRLTIGSSWTQDTSTTVGGDQLCATTTTNAVSFLPVENVDTFVIYYSKNTGQGTISFDINGGTATTVSQNTSAAFSTTTMTGTLGTNTLNIKYVSGGKTCITGIVAYNSAQKQVLSINGGYDGATAGAWNVTTNPWSPGTAIASFGQDLTVINLGINDWFASTGTSTFSTNMQALITQALTVGDVILMTPVPSISTAPYTQAVQQTYIASTKSLAVTNNIPFIDIFDRWVSYAVSNPLGLYYAGGFNLHPNGVGYADNTQSIFDYMDMRGTTQNAAQTGVNSGTLGQATYYASTGATVSGNSNVFMNSTKLGIGTTSPANTLSVNTGANLIAADYKGSSTTTVAVALNNTSSHQWIIASEGSAAADPGCFQIGDNTQSNGPFNICGANKTAAVLQAGVFAWSTAASFVSSTYDTGISRDSAGVIDIGNGTAGNKSGTINATTSTMTGISTAASFVPSGSTVATNGMYLSAANTLDFSTNSTKQIEVSSGGAVSMPNLTQTSAAQTGTVCSGTAGVLTVDTTLGCLSSLEELKDIQTGGIPNALDKIMKLKPFWYTWKRDSLQYKGNKEVQPGFGAHQVESVDKRLVGYGPDGKLRGVKYEQMTAVLAAAIQELKADNDNLHKEIDEMKKRTGQ